MSRQGFSAQSLSLSPFSHLSIAVEGDTKHQTIIIMLFDFCLSPRFSDGDIMNAFNATFPM